MNSTHEIIFNKYKQKCHHDAKCLPIICFWTLQGLDKTKKINSTRTIRAKLSTWNKLVNIRPEAMIDWRHLQKTGSSFSFIADLCYNGIQRDLWNALQRSKNEPGSWYQISNICGLLDSSEVRAYLPLRPSFIDSLIRPLVTIGFLMVQCKVNEWNIKVFLRKEISLVGCSGLVALIQKYHRICILSRILTLVSTQQDFWNIQDEICLFYQHNKIQREKVCYIFSEWYQIPCPNLVMSNFIWKID